MTTPERAEVWRAPDGSWRWRYVGTDGAGKPVEIPANEPESTREEAARAAQVAYPGLPVQLREPGAATQPGPPRPRLRRRTALVALAAGAAGALAVRRLTRRR